MRSVYLHLVHWLFHWEEHHMMEIRGREVYMRCQVCGLRTTGLEAGPLRLRSSLPGYPERARLIVSTVARVPMPPVFDFEVDAYPVPSAPWQRPDYPAESARVH